MWEMRYETGSVRRAKTTVGGPAAEASKAIMTQINKICMMQKVRSKKAMWYEKWEE